MTYHQSKAKSEPSTSNGEQKGKAKADYWNLQDLTPPFDEFGEIRGMSISKTTTAKSWKEQITINK